MSGLLIGKGVVWEGPIPPVHMSATRAPVLCPRPRSLGQALLYPDSTAHLGQLVTAARLLQSLFLSKFGACPPGPDADADAALSAFLSKR